MARRASVKPLPSAGMIQTGSKGYPSEKGTLSPPHADTPSKRTPSYRGGVRQGNFISPIWASTQFYADFSTVAAVTLSKPKLTRADYGKAYETIVDLILRGCLPQAGR